MSNTHISQVFSPLKTNGHCLGLGDFEEYGCILMPGNPWGRGTLNVWNRQYMLHSTVLLPRGRLPKLAVFLKCLLWIFSVLS